ncbi:TetR/AcrR family transcriptional regulator [Bradyrhizobium sp. LHD-71]|uniref:TetR/AcrR family transcriptional regulator n=1 Tax=Bradyrhizobium sp. LHD-71 TaxID=3072141 RepID=UPI00280E26D8|nr:TetR/AcrR family transcriptional regulator [Bradyrhizobium sp. LHD-71]MDQ8730217.1 TetR/AcrR family transcriptional regulator [Bradyrhizobium sp. LHD-71]
MSVTTLKRPRTKPAEIRREELIDAAQALFLSKGFDATSVDEIVRAADVAKGTFYFYFKTKDEVLQALRTRFIEGFCSRVEAAVERCAADDWTGRLDAWIEAGVNGYLDEFKLHDLVFHEFHPSNRRMKHDNPVIVHLRALIEGGARARAWSVKHPHLTAVMLFNALHGAVDDAIVSPTKVARKPLIAAVLSFCHRALGRE